ncbi:hypothetical protein [Thermosulfurimonas dismutans]|uniref:Uncharacterized protein n=1 Tax=Thermosulfurimonas dismutans TaxID=999894 RepID=A0A179D6V7_9BACT|nr:hypothetical protein [Thermosulfurimonas dismutans]OAQ21786.1 hypothetical protein TDIS_0304 [Thermosulfurimonas dismutans]
MPEKIRLPSYLRQTLYKRNLQINSFDKLPRPIRAEVLFKKKEILAFHQGKPFKALVEEGAGKELKIAFSEDKPTIKPNENLVLVVATPKERYVLQGKVEEVVDDHKVKLAITNPRMEERLEIPREEAVFISFLPISLFEALFSERYFLLRDTNISKETFEIVNKGYVYDLIIDQNENVVDEFSEILKTSGLVTFLKDISRGGACVFAKKVLSFDWHVLPIYLRGSINVSDEKGFTLGLVGMTRQIRVEGSQTFFHIMWARPLPEEVFAFIKALFS